MNGNERVTSSRFRKNLLAGVTGGMLAGLLVAYLESLFLLLRVGPFWVDILFLGKALLLYGLAGAAGGGLCALFLFVVFFRRRPLRHPRPWIFFFALMSTGGLGLEVIVYMLDIHTFRSVEGRWTASAWAALLGGILAAGLWGWLILKSQRQMPAGATRVRWRRGILAVALLSGSFLITRSAVILREGPYPSESPGRAGKGRANVIMLLVDSLRPDHLSAYGYPLPTSPAIDRLAGEGMLFANCYATSNWTVPTHTSIFTGLYPSAHGNYSLVSSLDATIPTLPLLLAGQGYRTASIFDNRLLGRRFGLARGFQTALGVDSEHKTSLAIHRLWQRFRNRRSMTRTILQVAAEWIAYRSPRRQRFFIFVNLLDAHAPYRPRQPYVNDFLRSLPAEKVQVELARRFTVDAGLSKKEAAVLSGRLTPSDWRWLERFYDSNIRAIDDQIHFFLERLQARGFLENTLVIVTSDHGEFFGEKGIGGHLAPSLHSAGLRVPLILWFPGRLAPSKVEYPVSQVDLFPTILDLAGFSAPLPGQGRNLLAAGGRREFLAEYWDDALKRFGRAYFSGDCKLVITPAGKRELYHLSNDRNEEHDLAGVHPGLADRLASDLQRLIRSMPARKIREKPGSGKETERLLRSLGYL